MFKQIRHMLYSMGVMTPKKLKAKIEYLQTFKINIYSINHSKYYDLYNKDIYHSISFYNNIIGIDFSERYVKELLVTKTFNIKLKEWYSNDRRLIDTDVINEWLTIVNILNDKYITGIANEPSGKIYSNSTKLKPHIIKIEEIVTDILANM